MSALSTFFWRSIHSKGFSKEEIDYLKKASRSLLPIRSPFNSGGLFTFKKGEFDTWKIWMFDVTSTIGGILFSFVSLIFLLFLVVSLLAYGKFDMVFFLNLLFSAFFVLIIYLLIRNIFKLKHYSKKLKLKTSTFIIIIASIVLIFSLYCWFYVELNQ